MRSMRTGVLLGVLGVVAVPQTGYAFGSNFFGSSQASDVLMLTIGGILTVTGGVMLGLSLNDPDGRVGSARTETAFDERVTEIRAERTGGIILLVVGLPMLGYMAVAAMLPRSQRMAWTAPSRPTASRVHLGQGLGLVIDL